MCATYLSSARRPAAVIRNSVRETPPSSDLWQVMYVGLFELLGVDAEVAVGRLEKFLEVVEGQPIVDGQGTDDAEPQALVDEPIEPQRSPRSLDGARLADRIDLDATWSRDLTRDRHDYPPCLRAMRRPNTI